MLEPITLIVRFRVKGSARLKFIESLGKVFEYIRKEETFIAAWLHEDIKDPESLLVYETWYETPESFMREQFSKPYRSGYEQEVQALNVDRSGAFYRTLSKWKR